MNTAILYTGVVQKACVSSALTLTDQGVTLISRVCAGSGEFRILDNTEITYYY